MRVWVFGDEVSTDAIAPGRYLSASAEELARHLLEPIAPDFARDVARGDILVAGRNFGCGSSREQAASGLLGLGVGAVCAESFARIFFRTAISIGLPAMTCPRITERFTTGDEVAFSLRQATILNLRTRDEMRLQPLPPFMLELLERGGILATLREKYSSSPVR